MAFDDFTLKKNLVALAIGKTLIDIDSGRYVEVANLLSKKYNIDLSDCYQYPVQLRDALLELYGKSSGFMIESIKQNLSGFPEHAEIAKFLEALSS